MSYILPNHFQKWKFMTIMTMIWPTFLTAYRQIFIEIIIKELFYYGQYASQFYGQLIVRKSKGLYSTKQLSITYDQHNCTNLFL